MDRNATKIFFSFDKSANSSVVLESITYLAMRTRQELVWVRSAETGEFENLGVDDAIQHFRMRYGASLSIQEVNSTIWESMQTATKSEDPYLLVISSAISKEGLLSAGMRGKVSKQKCAVLYLNPDASWQPPDRILMPLDSASETRQKLPVVARIATNCFSQVTYFGVMKKPSEDDAHHIRVYLVQANNYMVDRNIRVEDLDVHVSEDIACEVINVSMKYPRKWLTILSNSESGFKKSTFQTICENAGFPLLLVPHREIVGTGGSGY